MEPLPLEGLNVVEFSHMVMGPSIGLILADLGADVIKVEPEGGDHTRRLLGSGAGYFPMYNRNKRSICVDLKSPGGLAEARALVDKADILIENFRPGALEKLGLGPADFTQSNPRLIYCSAKGFLTGPYENRTALDEVAQMMGGLAYMTGPIGRPLRAGASVIDVTGGMFGVIGILAALERRHRTGRGGEVKCSLFETTAFLVGQHIAQMAVTRSPPDPMPARISAWAVYDVFETANPDEQLFVGVVSDSQWVNFCQALGLSKFESDTGLAKNNDRVRERDRILPALCHLFAGMTRKALVGKLEAIGVPFAPIARPQDLLNDPHMTATNGLIEVTLEDGSTAMLPALPIEIDGSKAGLRLDLPTAGRDQAEILGRGVHLKVNRT